MMTNPELDAIFQEYDQLAAQADQLFERVKNQYPEEVACASGCSSCCHAAFDLSLVEAMALNRAFNKEFDFGIRRSAVLQAAGDVDRQLARLKHHYFQQARQGMSDEEIMLEAAKERIRCPLLGLDDTCLLYEHRPITCRIRPGCRLLSSRISRSKAPVEVSSRRGGRRARSSLLAACTVSTNRTPA